MKQRLIAHPDSSSPQIDIGVKWRIVGTDVLKIEYAMVGNIDDIVIPAPAIPERADDLWRHTCFEAFVGMSDATSYVEFNFAPSRKKAIYRFEGYRDGMQPALDLTGPDIYVERDEARFWLTAWVDLKPFVAARPARMGFSAVIEATDGTKSYWALAHPPGKPDFHNADCFTARLAAPERA
jgi:hypothetical protein